ncbi:hypothetical protein DFH11DRAFT_91379 [Phellopilus nigrolimitatus]|nr:hypothetical protein DFH11DRAFT_91379 [Phellopilus nigrolimitatus]
MATTSCSGLICEVLELAVSTVGIFQLTKMLSLASMALYIYYFLSSLDHEVRYMWTARLGAGKILYFALRYYSLFAITYLNISKLQVQYDHEKRVLSLCFQFSSFLRQLLNCIRWTKFQYATAIIISLLSDSTLILRIYAMYNNSKRVLLLLITTLCATNTSTIVITTIMAEKESIFPAVFGSGVDMHMCVNVAIPGVFKFAWVAKLGHEALLCSFALYKGIQNFKRERGPADRLMAQLVKDSVLYFFMVFSIYLLSELVWITLGDNYTEAPIGFAMATVTIMCQGLLVHIRQQSLKRAFCITSAEIAWAPVATVDEEVV